MNREMLAVMNHRSSDVSEKKAWKINEVFVKNNWRYARPNVQLKGVSPAVLLAYIITLDFDIRNPKKNRAGLDEFPRSSRSVRPIPIFHIHITSNNNNNNS